MPAFIHPSMDESPPTEKTLAGQQQDPWQSYSPPSADKQDTYAYPQSGGGQGGQGGGQGAEAGQGAPGRDQAFARPAPGYQGPAYGIQDEAAPGQTIYDYGYQAQQNPPPQWQSAAGMAEGSMATADGEANGFFAALFDFGFNSFVTPKIVKVLYVLCTFWFVFWALIFMRLGFKYGGAAGGIFTLVVIDPIFLLLTLGVSRVVLEFFIVTHRMHDELRVIRDRADERAGEPR